MTLVSLLLTAVLSFSACSLRQYHFVNRSMSWAEAQRYCRENHTDLTPVNNTTDLQNIINTVNRQTVWIGLHKMNNITWKWSLGDQAFYIGNQSPYRDWGNGQPDNGEKDDCVFMEKDGKWHDARCTDGISFICYNGSSKTFILEHEHKTWHDAQSYCREKHTDLARVTNNNENDQMKELIKPNQNAWIGLFRDSSDQTVSQICTKVEVSQHRSWIDNDCNRTLPFVCHNDKLILFRENVTWTGALEHCRRNQMDLVCVESEEIQRGVMNVMKDASTSEVWLGLRHSCVVGIWFWVSGETMCYQNWAEGNGTGEEDCRDGGRAAAIQTGPDRTWISLPGTRKLDFICSKIP
ncbi:C-type mannose receptor 2-like isoform X1 [Triplophysa rosa]|uniref:C-type mannose receptor 2-like isoform X1 n=1 Tax=Triplophysa rosa TaxID=992332 RepID=UPI00254636EA|nr:C-type mannose receptor 2-like isoform X1 [Triplophysa rosa]